MGREVPGSRVEITLSGSGGQGMITASIILAEASAIYEGKNVVQTQVYGPEARGGATRADVIISSGEIRYPKVTRPDILVCLTQEAYDKFSPLVKPRGILIVDSFFVQNIGKPHVKPIQLELYRRVMERINVDYVLDICVLGALSRVSGVVGVESIERVIDEKFRPEMAKINHIALKLGIEIAGDIGL